MTATAPLRAVTVPEGHGVAAYAEAADAAIAARQPAWLRARREDAWQHFAAVGIPTSRHEEWRFTPVQELATPRFATPLPGEFAPREALPHGARLLPLREALALGLPELEAHLMQHATPEVTPFAALNAALFTDGAVLLIPDGVTIEEPIRLAHHATGEEGMEVGRTLVVLGRQASAVLVESFTGPAGSAYFTNYCTEIVLGEGARLEHLRIQDESRGAWHVGLTQVDQARASHYRSFVLDLGGTLARHNLHARHNAPAIETLLYGLYLPRERQVMDHHTAIHHDHPHCNSWEVYKGILGDDGRAVFNGKVLVASEAQRTDAKQTNRNLLLSDRARVDTKPQLEIFADDVKCTHGATIGKPDPLQRYYLQTRGIGGKAAQSLLLWAFAAEVLAEITVPALRQEVEQAARARLDEMVG